jgi:hypothetical protein
MPGQAEAPNMESAGRSTRRRRLRQSLPELLIEASWVVFAVLVAFAVDEWREHRADLELAARARTSILAELRANRDEVGGVVPQNTAHLAHATALAASARNEGEKAAGAKAADEKDGGEPLTIELSWEVAQVSFASWQAAQSTRATQFLDYNWVVRVARLYEVQHLYNAAQEHLVFALSEGSGSSKDPAQGHAELRRIRRQMDILSTLEKNLLARYDEFLKAPPPPP